MKIKIFDTKENLKHKSENSLLKQIELEYKPSIGEFIKYDSKDCEIMKIIHNDNFIEVYIAIPETNKVELR